MRPEPTGLSLDVYALTMVQGYLANGMDQTAVFEFFVREQPRNRNFFIAAGLEQILDDLEHLQFSAEELEWLAHQPGIQEDLMEWLEDFRFSGNVHAVPEGTVFFANEPILRVTAPLPQAQLIEARVINRLQFQTVIASKAVRCVLAAPNKQLVDYGLRRAHGLEAGLLVARACYLAGFAGTSNVLAGKRFGIPTFGTMAHSFVQAHDSETEAFEHFAQANPEDTVLVLDTYETEAAAKKVVALGPVLKERGITIQGVRIDSGNLAKHAHRVRSILNQGGLKDVRILASGNLDEVALSDLVSAQAPIDGYGIGTKVATSVDTPALNCAYKLQSYAGQPRRKSSEGKATWPGVKQVYRAVDSEEGCMILDTVTLETDVAPNDNPLLKCLMTDGQRTTASPSLTRIRDFVDGQIKKLPASLRSFEPSDEYPVAVSDSLTRLAATLDAERSTGVPKPGHPLNLSGGRP